MRDPYLDELKSEFDNFSNQLKKLKKRLLKTSSIEEQKKIIEEIDTIARRIENNQKQSLKVAKLRLKKLRPKK